MNYESDVKLLNHTGVAHGAACTHERTNTEGDRIINGGFDLQRCIDFWIFFNATLNKHLYICLQFPGIPLA